MVVNGLWNETRYPISNFKIKDNVGLDDVNTITRLVELISYYDYIVVEGKVYIDELAER